MYRKLRMTAVATVAAAGMALGTASAAPATAAPTVKSGCSRGFYGYFSTGGGNTIHGQYRWCPSGKYQVMDTSYDGYAVRAVINSKVCTSHDIGRWWTCYINPRGAKYVYLYLSRGRGHHLKFLGRERLTH